MVKIVIYSSFTWETNCYVFVLFLTLLKFVSDLQ